MRLQTASVHVSPAGCSNNALSELPEAVFRLWSLRTLSAAQNKIEHLRLPSGGDPRQTLPVLEELYLQVRGADTRGGFRESTVV